MTVIPTFKIANPKKCVLHSDQMTFMTSFLTWMPPLTKISQALTQLDLRNVASNLSISQNFGGITLREILQVTGDWEAMTKDIKRLVPNKTTSQAIHEKALRDP